MVNQLVQDIAKTASAKLAALNGLKDFVGQSLYKDFNSAANRSAMMTELKNNIFTKDLLKSTLVGSGAGAGLGGLYGAIKGYRGSNALGIRNKLKDALRQGTKSGLKGSLVGGLGGAAYGGVKGLDSAAANYYAKAQDATKAFVDLHNMENDIYNIFKNYKIKQDNLGELFHGINRDYTDSVWSNRNVPTSDLNKTFDITNDIVNTLEVNPQKFKPMGDIKNILSNYKDVPVEFTRSIFSEHWLDINSMVNDLHRIGNNYNKLRHLYNSNFKDINNNPYLSPTILKNRFGLPGINIVMRKNPLGDLSGSWVL